MLAPDDIEPSLKSIRGFYFNTITSDKLATMNRTLTIYPVKKETPWITEFREKAKILSTNGVAWEKEKVQIIPNVLSPFLTYKNIFSSVARLLPRVQSGEMAADILQRLLDAVENNILTSREANEHYSRWIQSTKSNVDLLNESIDNAWRDLGASEKKIVNFSEHIVKTQNKIASLADVIAPSSISSGTIGDIKDIVSNIASMSYTVIVQGYAIPYLSVGVMFFTLGKTFYDIFSTAGELQKELDELSKYRLDLTYEEQALAQTKASLTLVYEIKSLIEQQVNALGAIETFWKNEKRNISTVRDSFLLTENYNPDNPEVFQLKIAESVWNSLQMEAKHVGDKFSAGIQSDTNICIGK